jgi:predicted ATP-grasp superfamily ATP-dependent carboligase
VRIFAYEHITGGGLLSQQALAALAPEGELMLRSLVQDLLAVRGVQVTVMRDPRLTFGLPVAVRVPATAGQFWPTFRRAVREADAVWPIAPEQGGVLERLSGEVIDGGRRLLGSGPAAVSVAASKLRTAAALAAAGVETIPTFADEDSVPDGVHEIVVKPDDGAGCQDTYLVEGRAALRRYAARDWIFQPFVRGEALSLSMLCCEQRARLLACNRQHVRINHGRFEFSGVSVNAVPDRDGRYAQLAQKVARALPGLWGYVGIDVIDAADGPVVVEINPRLTTSYAGLSRAIGVNPARLVLELPGSLDTVPAPSPDTVVEVELTHAD